ncbi:LuxR family transcriptional regulator [Kutzneria buriramensis]|uniref:Regulatory LuxR family protein n=1 Tax=Kutzneria buriramensis TaxID=1045776 RepID=A0A3E0GZ87_9PSEU|nr:LuxR family transcriptional regulator [Kutzneria buriramensis]REH33117.1 regulatory LuxR family protein [Kutzneria buriramensis]
MLVGRAAELDLFRALLRDLVAGRGRSVLVEGEPGIGKSALVNAGLVLAATLGCRVLWAAADELVSRFPLQALRDALTPAERESLGPCPAVGDPVTAGVERFLALADQLCADSPVVLVLDDLHWADDASLLTWGRLSRAVDQVPLLLVATCRPVPRRAQIAELRRTLTTHGTTVMRLRALPDQQVDELVDDLVGAPSGPRLRAMARQAGGNPLFVRELVDALVREQHVERDGFVELAAGIDRAPASLGTAIADRLAFLSDATTRVLRPAVLLGNEFSLADLAAVSGHAPPELADGVEEAMSAGVLAERGDRLAFRHPLIRHALYAAIPEMLRSALHQDAAHALVRANGPVERISAQLTAARGEMADWVPQWLAEHSTALTQRASPVAERLLTWAVARIPPDDPLHDELKARLAITAFLLGNGELSERLARQVLARTRDPEMVAKMRWTVVGCLHRSRRFCDAREMVEVALRDPELPPLWEARLLAISVRLRRSGRRFDDSAAEKALTQAELADDPVAIGYALHEISLVRLRQRDTAGALRAVRRALRAVGDNPYTTDLRQTLLIDQTAFLAQLDSWDEVRRSVREAIELAEHTGTPRLCHVYTNAADIWFAMGQWDDALAASDVAAEHLPAADSWPELWERVYGMKALIAGHRDDVASVEADLNRPKVRGSDSILLVRARAMAEERAGRPEGALAVLRETLDPNRVEKYQYLRHRWSPQLVRLAMELGDLDTARRASDLCEYEAEAEPIPVKTAAARWCRGLLVGDWAALLEAAEYFRTAGRPLELGHCLEDAAVLMAYEDRPTALRTLTEAVDAYLSLGATWDVMRADSRARRHGVRRGRRGPRNRPSTGWDALTVTESKVATLVADGLSNPDIAALMFLSRRTVQTHVSHILAKLGAQSRVEIARLSGERSG